MVARKGGIGYAEIVLGMAAYGEGLAGYSDTAVRTVFIDVGKPQFRHSETWDLLAIRGDGPQVHAEIGRIFAHDRGGEKLRHVFEVLRLKLFGENVAF